MFSLLGLKDRKSKKSKESRQSLFTLMKILGLMGIFCAFVIGLSLLNDYVTKRSDLANTAAILKLVDAPIWVNQGLKEKIYSAAMAGGEDLRLDDEAAASVQQNLSTFVTWLDNVEVQATHDSLLVTAYWRKPVARFEIGSRYYYVDADMVVLDYVAMDTITIVDITGISTDRAPKAGVSWDRDDVKAAINIISALTQMDNTVCPDKPLLNEIKNVDMSNYNGRYFKSEPHILMYAADETQIIWGVEYGRSTEYLEVPDHEKMTRLYHFYNQHGTLSGIARYINLCDPRDYIPQPIDEY